MLDRAMRDKLVHAVMRFDIGHEKRARNSRHGYHNPYALGHYLKGVDNTAADMAKGASLARALYDNFNDRLLTVLERAAGVPVTYGGGSADKGRPT